MRWSSPLAEKLSSASSQAPSRWVRKAASSVRNDGWASWLARIGVTPTVSGAANPSAASASSASTSGR